MFEKIKDIIFKVKDYDRLEHDYSCILSYVTDGRLSKTNYLVDGLYTVIGDILTEHDIKMQDEIKEELIAKALGWLKENADGYTWYDEMHGESGVNEEFFEDFKKEMENVG